MEFLQGYASSSDSTKAEQLLVCGAPPQREKKKKKKKRQQEEGARGMVEVIDPSALFCGVRLDEASVGRVEAEILRSSEITAALRAGSGSHVMPKLVLQPELHMTVKYWGGAGVCPAIEAPAAYASREGCKIPVSTTAVVYVPVLQLLCLTVNSPEPVMDGRTPHVTLFTGTKSAPKDCNVILRNLSPSRTASNYYGRSVHVVVIPVSVPLTGRLTMYRKKVK